MTCMAEAGRLDREKLNMVAEGQSDEVGLFFVRFFGAGLYLASGMGAAGVSCGLRGKGGKKNMLAGGGGCHSSLQGGLIGVGYCLPCALIKNKISEEEKKMRNEKWRKILLAVGIAFAVLMAVVTLWARMHRNITAEDLAVRQNMREYDLSESEARWFVEWAEKVINME